MGNVPKIYTDSDIKNWKAMKDKGYPLKEICSKYKVFGGTVLRKIKEYEEKNTKEETISTAGEEELPPYVKKTPLVKKKNKGDEMPIPKRLDEDERIEAKKSLRFDPDLLKIAEWTVGQGLAKDLSSAIRAWGKDYYYRHSDIIEDEMAPKPKGNEASGKEFDLSEIIRMMKQKVTMQTMADLSDKKSSGNGGINLEKIIALSFLDKKDNPGLNPQIQALQQEIKSLRDSQMQQNQMQKFEAMFQNLQNQINAAAAQNKGGDWKDILALTEKSKADLEKIRTEHEQRMEEQRMKVETAKDETNKFRFDTLQNDVKNQIGQVAEAYKWKDDLSKKYMEQAMKLLDDQYLKGAKAISGEKSTGQLAKDFVSDFIGQIKGPILEPMGRAMAEKMSAPTPGFTPQQFQAIQDAQKKFHQQQQLAKEAVLKKSNDLMMD